MGGEKLRVLAASGCERSEVDGVGPTVAAAVDKLRDGFGRLRVVMDEHCQGTGNGSCTMAPSCSGYSAIRDVLQMAAGAEEQLSEAAARAARQGNMLAQLASATQGIASIESAQSLVTAIPELALLVCAAGAAVLVKVSKDGGVQLVARCGVPFTVSQEIIENEARAAAREGARFSGDCDCEPAPGDASARRGRMVTLPLDGGEPGMVLVLERADGKSCFEERELEHLQVYGSLAGTALARARAAVELQQAAARDAAILAAIKDGVIAVDHEGVVRALNQAGAASLGLRREDVLGKRLRSVPGLAPLANALAVAPSQVMEVVTLPRGDVVVRAQLHDGGVVATLRDSATEQTIAQKLVGSTARYTFDHIVGRAPALVRVVEEARRAARSEVPILICGESGTGKELLAQAVHNASAAAAGPFIGINVTAIPRELLESELFGYEGGTFTGARAQGRAGKFELAGRGTLLLDEIGDMPLEMQGKLLRVLQERVVQRLGSARDIQVRARIIATTHRNLYDAVREGRFRLDLFHRLCVLQLTLPSLRDRGDDVPLLVEHHLRLHAERTGRKIKVAPHVLAAFEAYDWPGNVRQLVNVLDGELSVLGPGENQLTRIPPALAQSSPRPRRDADEREEVLSLDEIERRACERTLAFFGGNVARAAQALGVAKGTLYSKMKRYGLEPSSTPARGSGGVGITFSTGS